VAGLSSFQARRISGAAQKTGFDPLRTFSPQRKINEW